MLQFLIHSYRSIHWDNQIKRVSVSILLTVDCKQLSSGLTKRLNPLTHFLSLKEVKKKKSQNPRLDYHFSALFKSLKRLYYHFQCSASI